MIMNSIDIDYSQDLNETSYGGQNVMIVEDSAIGFFNQQSARTNKGGTLTGLTMNSKGNTSPEINFQDHDKH